MARCGPGLAGLLGALWRELLRLAFANFPTLTCGCLNRVVCFTATASQLGFYYVTGAELQWDAASSIASDETAVKFMLTGIVQVMVAGCILLAATFLTTPFLYNAAGVPLTAIWRFVTPASWGKEHGLPIARIAANHMGTTYIWPWFSGAFMVSVLILQVVRPSQPYNHISATLPYSMLRIIHQPHPDICSMLLYGEAFPLADLVEEKYWEQPDGDFKGWAPGMDNHLVRQYQKHRPEWLSAELPSGFYRWDAKKNGTRIPGKPSVKNSTDITSKCAPDEGPNYYSPVADPLRITNLNTDIYEPLRQAFESNSVLVSHVILLSMESSRKELFPIREGSNLHSRILETHMTEDQKANASELLSKMTPVAHQVTGEPYWSDPAKNTTLELKPGQWKDSAAPGMGGLNVMGAMTGSTLSFKSFLGSHCGVCPLPVDFLEEVTTEYYQPCIPQILKLFSQSKDGESVDKRDHTDAEEHRAAIQNQKWKNVYIQTTTDGYDRQGVMNEQIGFEEFVYKNTFKDKNSPYYPPKSPELNYFG